MSLRDIQTEALSLMAQHDLLAQGWRFRFDTAKRRSGCCNYSTKTISLSKTLYSLETNQDKAHNTILHEIAHALVGPGHHHDSVWQRTARQIGCTGDRCSSLPEQVKGKYQGTCACGVDHHHLHRMKRTSGGVIPRYTCNTCRQQVTWRITR